MIDYYLRRNEFASSKNLMLMKLSTEEAPLYFRSAYYEYRSLALCDLFLQKDTSIVKGWFYKAARVQELQYRIGKGEYEVSVELDKPKLCIASGLGFIWTILSDSQSLKHNFAEAVSPLGDYGEYLTMYGYYLGWAMKHLLLGQIHEAHGYVLKAQKKKSRYHKGYSWVVQGILEKEPAFIQQGLDMQIAVHKKMEKGSIFFGVDLVTTALAKLAVLHGFTPDVSSPFINKDLLFYQPNIEYEDITEVLDALRVRSAS